MFAVLESLGVSGVSWDVFGVSSSSGECLGSLLGCFGADPGVLLELFGLSGAYLGGFWVSRGSLGALVGSGFLSG